MAKRQAEIPGTERPSIPELDELAAPYTEALYERMRLQGEEKALKAQLIQRMAEMKPKVKEYTYQDGEYAYTFGVDQTAKLKCKRRRIGSDEDEGVPVEDDE